MQLFEVGALTNSWERARRRNPTNAGASGAFKSTERATDDDSRTGADAHGPREAESFKCCKSG